MVFGVSDQELASARPVLMPGKAPAHRGASVTSKCVLHGDPPRCGRRSPQRRNGPTASGRAPRGPRSVKSRFGSTFGFGVPYRVRPPGLGPTCW
eukprot:138192-Pyramimonas_sp.AAC.1